MLVVPDRHVRCSMEAAEGLLDLRWVAVYLQGFYEAVVVLGGLWRHWVFVIVTGRRIRWRTYWRMCRRGY